MDELDLLRTDDFDTTYVPTKWDLYEAMDRSSILINNISDALNNHPGLNEEESRKASRAFSLLFEIYQSTGATFFEMTKDEE